MHTDAMLSVLDDETTALGNQLRDFQAKTCSSYATRELKREAEARKRCESKQKPTSGNAPNTSSDHHPRMLNLQTYKAHSLGDYVNMIKMFSTTDSYNSEIVLSPSYFRILLSNFGGYL